MQDPSNTKREIFMRMVNSWKLLTYVTKNTILYVTWVLDFKHVGTWSQTHRNMFFCCDHVIFCVGNFQVRKFASVLHQILQILQLQWFLALEYSILLTYICPQNHFHVAMKRFYELFAVCKNCRIAEKTNLTQKNDSISKI